MHLLLPSSAIKSARRRGQSAVETMLMVFGLMVVLMSMVHLWQVTWGAQNANLRAREVLLHGDAYLDPGRASYTSFNDAEIPFDVGAGTYKKATAGSAVFSASAQDRTKDDIIGSQTLEVTLQIRVP